MIPGLLRSLSNVLSSSDTCMPYLNTS
jgi:hypothetical protein